MFRLKLMIKCYHKEARKIPEVALDLLILPEAY